MDKDTQGTVSRIAYTEQKRPALRTVSVTRSYEYKDQAKLVSRGAHGCSSGIGVGTREPLGAGRHPDGDGVYTGIRSREIHRP